MPNGSSGRYSNPGRLISGRKVLPGCACSAMRANGWANGLTGLGMKKQPVTNRLFCNSNELFYLNHNDKNTDVFFKLNEMPVKPFIFVSTRAFKQIQPFFSTIKLSGMSGFFFYNRFFSVLAYFQYKNEICRNSSKVSEFF